MFKRNPSGAVNLVINQWLMLIEHHYVTRRDALCVL